MSGHLSSAPEVARARIAAMFAAAKRLSVSTGGDPAECAFELIAAAILVLHESRPMKPPAELICGAAPHAAATVEAWFDDELKSFRRGHA